MSDLLNEASLVLIPSGTKASKVYAQIPEDGSGDMTFSRASDATRVNSLGLVEKVRTNVALYSQEFGNGVWSTYSTINVVANTATAPDGTTTADKLVPTTVNTGHACEQNIGSTSNTIVMSLYAKANGYDWLCFNSYISGFNFTWFNISSGTIGTIASGVTAKIESVGNGWYRCSVQILGGSGTYFSIIPTNNNNVSSFAGDGTSGILVWGAQLEISDFGPTAYIPTTSSAVSVGPYSNIPRLNYQNGGGGCPSLLLEAQRTNLVNYSEQFNNGYWGQIQATATANNTTSPDGYQNADKIIPSTVNTYHYLEGSAVTVSNNAMVSIYAKKGEYQRFALRSYITGNNAIFDVNSGTVVSTTNTTASITSVGNGWYRCSLNDTNSTAWGLQIFIMGNTSTNPTDSYSGNGTDGMYFWGAQIEVGSYPSSYIPTLGTSVTRVADACYKTGISSLIGQTEGTIFLDWVQNALSNSQGIYANNYNLTGSISIQVAINGTLDVFVCYAGTYFSISTSSNAIQIGQRYKVGFAYKSGNLALYLNGNLIGTNTTSFAFTTTLSEIDLSNRTVFFANVSEISANQLVQFPTRLTNAQLAELTA